MNVVAFVMNAGLLFMLLLPGVAALLVKLRRRPGARPGRAGERAAEIDDVFNPGRRRQVEQMEVSDTLRVDAETGDGDPLEEFPDPDALRDQLDPERMYEPRRARAGRNADSRRSRAAIMATRRGRSRR